MENLIIVLVLLVVVGGAAWQTARKFRRGGGCCGSHETVKRTARVRDRNKAHYPYQVTLQIGGMTCENCARRVENALNRLDGAWATVRIGSHSAVVRLKAPPDEAALRRAVRDAGYTVTGCCQTQ